jgi:hypothetical protein
VTLGSAIFGSAVHGVVGELVGGLVFVAQGVGDLEAVELRDAAAGFLPERAEVGRVHLVLALDLLDHELGVGDDAEAAVVVVERPLEAAEQAGVFGVVVGAVAEELGQLGQDAAGFVLQERALAGGAGVAAGSAVAVGGDPAGLGAGGGFVGEEIRGGSGHREQFTACQESFLWRCYRLRVRVRLLSVVTLTPESETA